MTGTTARMLMAFAVAAAAAGPAVAAEPGSGAVSLTSPRITWAGEVAMSYFNRLPVLITDDDSVPCAPETCDFFDLEVLDRATLRLTATAPETSEGAPASVTMRVVAPGGEVTITTGDATPQAPHALTIREAATGVYTIEYFNNFIGTHAEYTGTAELLAPPPARDPVPRPLTLRVEPAQASARALRRSRKLEARVTVSRQVRSVVGVLKRRGRVHGRGRLGSFSGERTLAIRLRREVERGRHRLVVRATDPDGAQFTRAVAVRVRR